MTGKIHILDLGIFVLHTVSEPEGKRGIMIEFHPKRGQVGPSANFGMPLEVAEDLARKLLRLIEDTKSAAEGTIPPSVQRMIH